MVFTLSHWPRAVWWSADRNDDNNFDKNESGAAAFLARFGSGLGSGLVLGLGIGVGLGLRPARTLIRPGSDFCSQTRTAHRPKDPGG